MIKIEYVLVKDFYYAGQRNLLLLASDHAGYILYTFQGLFLFVLSLISL